MGGRLSSLHGLVADIRLHEVLKGRLMSEKKKYKAGKTIYFREDFKELCLEYCARHPNYLGKPMALSEMVGIGLAKVLDEES